MTRLRFLILVLAVAALAVVAVDLSGRRVSLPDAFTSESVWNTPIPADAPVHPRSADIVAFLASDNILDGCITLAGIGNKWGLPIYLADDASPEYDVVSSKYEVPSEFSSLRIPRDALPADNSDGEMIVYDLARGYVAHLSKASYDSAGDRWTVTGGSISYLASNGLDGSLPESDEPRNGGSFRGYNGAVAAVHYDDIAEGTLDNVVKIGVNNSHIDSVWPMIGSDGDLETSDAPLQGMRLRIRPDLNLESLGLEPQALVIARGLQEYGAIIGDSTGGSIVLTLEDMDRAGTGGQWELDKRALCTISATDFQIIDNPDG